MELPANMMTPTAFCERVQKEFEGVANVEITVRDEKWAEEKGMVWLPLSSLPFLLNVV